MNNCKYMDMKCEYANRLGMCKNTTAICARKSNMILIDTDEFKKKFFELETEFRPSQIDAVFDCLCNSEILDAVEVVRCKDCKNLGENDGYYFCNAIGIAFGDKPDWFCADGERKHE